MKTISRYIMTLALLITAVGGAWAQSTVQCSLDDITIEPGGSATTNFNLTNPDDKFCACQFTIQFPQGISIAYDTDEEEYVASLLRNGKKHHSLDVVYNSVYTVTVSSNQDFQGTEGPLINFSIVADNNAVAGNYDCYITNVTLTKTEGDPVTFESIPFKVTISGSEPADADPTIEVTTDAAEEGATFTEASFEMPTSDVTAEYELVRDMSYKVAFSGVPTRARLAKDGNGKFHFADGLTFQLLDNIDAANPKDITSAEGITFMVGEVVTFDFEGSTFYQLDKETLVPLADFLADAHLGNYAICAVASTGEYDGSFSSGMMTLFQGYEVEVAAKEFITYYKDEPLYVEDEAAELYTISSVNGDQAVLSDKSDAMPSNTPMLVYNKSNETKVILLIPCAEPDMAITVAPEFQGTLTGTTIAASTDAQTNYALNGKQFVFVKNAIEIGANKAWLSIPSAISNARALNIVFSDATGVNGVIGVKEVNDGSWYDLNGRKLQGIPTKKGVYIMNGRKVVIR